MNPWFLAHVVAALNTTLRILVSQVQFSHAFSATVTWRHSTTSSPAAVFMVDDEHAACAAGLSQQHHLPDVCAGARLALARHIFACCAQTFEVRNRKYGSAIHDYTLQGLSDNINSCS
jgi:hypothetical protein